jgi:hypothetical protein
MFSRIFPGTMPSRNFFSSALSCAEEARLYPAIVGEFCASVFCPKLTWAESNAPIVTSEQHIEREDMKSFS